MLPDGKRESAHRRDAGVVVTSGTIAIFGRLPLIKPPVSAGGTTAKSVCL